MSYNRDFNRDGRADRRDYYDDLGGAYHFAPRDMYTPGMSRGESCLIAVVELVAGLLLLWLSLRI